MPPKAERKRTPGPHNGSPLSPPAGEGSGAPNPQLGQATSPLTSTLRFKRQSAAEYAVASKVQTFTTAQRLFLAHDFESVSKKPTKLDYYNIIYLFNPGTKSRPGQAKDVLKQAFLDEVRPLLLPYIVAPPPVAMETDSTEPDFDPLDRKTTRGMLSKPISIKAPQFNLPTSATINDTLIAYKYYVDPQLPLKPNDRFVKRPRTVPVNRLKGETIEDILLALRYLAPNVFVRSLAMNKPCLVDIYIKFVHEQKTSYVNVICHATSVFQLSGLGVCQGF
ncbi:uncharacterized protein MELLADRAFT_113919 [Melampsora larici-populina 98AG31]|uniref:Uncharacterized protein n=1 Tax=Melampsora larici-populina (strain 98AG31 / pathotype 3-4-7) TaxID=747676 RepID=F4SBH8_MELLP|nr:uncharacterized protein MELLADRAFT_113919 [Melampsora larici-populina 98AG31]EGF97991.1 hypothetical protein MELLADRAFT_113919 [Melampsora larici-populina 98AG31]